MDVRTIEAFAVHGDSGGERGIGPIEGYCETRTDAEVMCKGRGWYGGNGAITSVHMLVVGDSMYALANPTPVVFMSAAATLQAQETEARERALAKLTPADRRVLGLT